MGKERERERLVEERRGRREVRERSVEEPPPVATKSLEELFKKTTAGPAIYWRPLSEEEIQAKIDEKKKMIEEVKSQKDMMSSKEAQEKTKKMGKPLALSLHPTENVAVVPVVRHDEEYGVSRDDLFISVNFTSIIATKN